MGDFSSPSVENSSVERTEKVPGKRREGGREGGGGGQGVRRESSKAVI